MSATKNKTGLHSKNETLETIVWNLLSSDQTTGSKYLDNPASQTLDSIYHLRPSSRVNQRSGYRKHRQGSI